MPGETQLNVRVTKEQVERLKEAARLKRLSLTTFLTSPALAWADKLLGGDAQLEAEQKEPAKPVEKKVGLVDAYGIELPPARPESGAASMSYRDRNPLLEAERRYDEAVKMIRQKRR